MASAFVAMAMFATPNNGTSAAAALRAVQAAARTGPTRIEAMGAEATGAEATGAEATGAEATGARSAPRARAQDTSAMGAAPNAKRRKAADGTPRECVKRAARFGIEMKAIWTVNVATGKWDLLGTGGRVSDAQFKGKNAFMAPYTDAYAHNIGFSDPNSMLNRDSDDVTRAALRTVSMRPVLGKNKLETWTRYHACEMYALKAHSKHAYVKDYLNKVVNQDRDENGDGLVFQNMPADIRYTMAMMMHSDLTADTIEAMGISEEEAKRDNTYNYMQTLVRAIHTTYAKRFDMNLEPCSSLDAYMKDCKENDQEVRCKAFDIANDLPKIRTYIFRGAATDPKRTFHGMRPRRQPRRSAARPTRFKSGISRVRPRVAPPHSRAQIGRSSSSRSTPAPAGRA